MENELFAWFKIKREKHLWGKYHDIINKAKEINSDSQFKASSGWFKNFRTRYKISRRMPIHVIQKLLSTPWIAFTSILQKFQIID